MTKIEELRAAFEAATQEQAASLEAGVAMQAKLLDFGELAHNNMPALLEAVRLLEEVRNMAEAYNIRLGGGIDERVNAALEKLK